MHVLIWIYCFLAVLIGAQALPTKFTSRRNHQKQDVSQCKPGYYFLKHYDESQRVLCRPCPPGTFSHRHNTATECNPCSKCGPTLFELKQCTRTSDVFCESCASKHHRHLKTYLEFCLGYDGDVSEMQSDQASISTASENSVDNVDGNSKLIDPLKPEANDLKLLGTDPKSEEATKEESEEMNAVKDGEKVDEGEGSGSVDDLQVVTLPPSEVLEDELLPFMSGNAKDLDEIHSLHPATGVQLAPDDAIEGSGGDETWVVNLPTVVEDLPYSGDGEVIGGGAGSENDTVDTIIISGLNISSNLSSENVVVFPLEGDDEAATSQDELHTAAVSNRQRAVIIIGVVVGAVAFFVLSFVASRLYKRKRSFKILQPGPDSNNRTDDNTKEAIEFQDMSQTTGIYDEPDTLNTNGQYKKTGNMESNGTKAAAANDDVYAVPLKKAQRPRTNSEQDKHVNGIDKMKYMDESDMEDDGATERLLPNQDGDAHNTSLTDVVLDKLDQRLSPIEEERAPMLPKSGQGKDKK